MNWLRTWKFAGELFAKLHLLLNLSLHILMTPIFPQLPVKIRKGSNFLQEEITFNSWQISNHLIRMSESSNLTDFSLIVRKISHFKWEKTTNLNFKPLSRFYKNAEIMWWKSLSQSLIKLRKYWETWIHVSTRRQTSIERAIEIIILNRN